MTVPSLLVVVLAVLLAGCGSIPGGSLPPDPPVPGDPSRLAGEWRLTGGTHNGDRLPLPADAPITMTIADGEIGGRAACNTYGGELRVDGDALAIGAMSMTEMGCDPAIMEAESAYIAALADVATWQRAGDRLMLTGNGVELVYDVVAPEADADLVGTRWTLDGLIDGDAVSSTMGDELATLELSDDGTFTGSTGCRGFGGRYELDGNSVNVGDLVTDDRACPALATQDEHVLAALRDGFSFTVTGNRLTLGAGGIGLTYVADAG